MKKWKILTFGAVVYVLIICVIGIIEMQSADANIKSFADAFWFAIVTLTTVGYGDFYPVTPFGKIIGLFLIIGSIGILGFIIGEITNRFNQYMEKKKLGLLGTDFSDHYVIIGWNEFGQQVADQILNTSHKIAVVSNSKDDIERINDLYENKNCFALFADFNNFESLKKLNISSSKGVFVNFTDDTETLVYVLDLKNYYPKLKLIVKCKKAGLKQTFHNAGIKHVISECEVTAKLVASHIFEPEVASLTEDLIATSVDNVDYDIQQYKILADNINTGKQYIDVFLSMKKEFNAVCVGLVKKGILLKNPEDSILVEESDYLILISNGNAKAKLEIIFGTKEGA